MGKRLTLSIKQKFFDQIVDGSKTIETREIRPSNVKKYCKVDDEGYVVENDEGIVPVKYGEIKLLTGAYSGIRPYIVTEVKSAEVLLLTDEDGEFIELEDENRAVYLAAVIEYQLGDIIEKSITN